MKILVIQIKMIGDVLASSIICEAIKTQYPDCEVHYLIQKGAFPVVENNPFVDKIVFFEAEMHKGLGGLFRFGKVLREEHYDAIIDVYGKWQSLIPAFVSKSPRRIGFSKSYKNIFYTQTVVPKQNISGEAIVHRLQLAEAYLNENTALEFPKIYLTNTEISDAKTAIAKLNTQRKIIMISLLGSDENKSLPNDYMAEMLDKIAISGDFLLLFNFMPDQKHIAQEIYNLCKPETQKSINFEFYTKSLREFLGVLSQCDALIGNEGGAVNIAKALRIKTFTVFSPWIEKKSWDMLEDNQAHVSVHLRDYFPEVYKNQHPKKFKKKALKMYDLLKPALFYNQLLQFLKHV
uniref:glycosyltransferase family 9 protein n=1 Tax=Flavobacterium sp. TaxID=239 RepID=UPI00404AEBD6